MLYKSTYDNFDIKKKISNCYWTRSQQNASLCNDVFQRGGVS